MATETKAHTTIRNNLDAAGRHFAYNSTIAATYDKEYKVVSNDIRLLKFAEDEFGAISDIYILYAVICMGVADSYSIYQFLRNLKKKNKDLNIGGSDDPDAVKLRLRKLFQLGLLFKHKYDIPMIGDDGKPFMDNVTMFTATSVASTMVNHKLGCHTQEQPWIQMKPLYELQAWAACGMVANYVDSFSSCIERKQGLFKTPYLGNMTVIPCILKVKNPSDEVEFVGFIPSFFHMNSAAQTKEQFFRDVEYRINVMRQFLFSQDKKEHLARLVVVVEDSADLNVVVNYILKSEELKEDFYRIYFTGEGALLNSADREKGQDCFLGIKESKTKSGFSYYAVKPDFLPK